MSREHPALPRNRTPATLPSTKSTHSFWHTQPSPLLTAHRSTRNLPKSADVVVIGSGITGASIVHHLLSPDAVGSRCTDEHGKGLDVVLLEAREACWGATGRNGGHCQPLLFENPHDPSIGHFELRNFRALQSLVRDKNIDCEFVAQPGVRAIYSRHHLDEVDMALHIMQSTSPELASMMKLVTEKADLEKFRIPTALGAVVTTIAARLWPYKFVARILEDLITSNELGGTFNLQTLTPVEGLAPSGDGNGRWMVKTSRGSVEARKVILATNAYTSYLIPKFADLIVPCRGQMSALKPLPPLAGNNRLQTSLGFLGDGLDDYLIQRPNESGGHLMFGGGRQQGPSIGVTDDSVLEVKTAKYLRTRLVETLGLRDGDGTLNTEFEAANEWTGIMGFSRDERPWVGAVPGMTNVFMSAGYTGHGMPNTWLCGKTVARMAAASFLNENQELLLETAANETGLPFSYRLTEERMQRAMEVEDVQIRDWVEMNRGKPKEDGRPPSGYA